jgi:hypothetical protein
MTTLRGPRVSIKTFAIVAIAVTLVGCGANPEEELATASQDAAAAEIRLAATAAQLCYSTDHVTAAGFGHDTNTYLGCTAELLSKIERSLSYVDGSSPGIRAVSVSDGAEWVGAMWSREGPGTCYTVVLPEEGGAPVYGQFTSSEQSCKGERVASSRN